MKNTIENYKPTDLEIQAAESTMTDEQKEMSKGKEAEYTQDIQILERAVEDHDTYVLSDFIKKYPEESKNIISAKVRKLIQSFNPLAAEELVKESGLSYEILAENTRDAIKALETNEDCKTSAVIYGAFHDENIKRDSEDQEEHDDEYYIREGKKKLEQDLERYEYILEKSKTLSNQNHE